MSSTKYADVIIVGSGIVGSSAAYYLAKKGCSSIVLDRDIIGNGASSRNGGGVRASGRDAREIPLADYAIKNIWPNLGEELEEDIEYEQGGNLRFARGEEERKILENLVKVSQKQGISVNMLYGREAVKKLCPYVADDITVAAWCPTDGHANPLKTTLGIYKKARQLGAHYYTGEEVIGLRKIKGRIGQVISASGNVYEGDHVILAAGYESRAIANTVGVDIPFRQKLIEVFITEQAPKLFSFMMSAPAGFYGHQTQNGSFIFGGDSGFEHHPVFRKSTLTLQVTASAISRGVMEYFPILGDLKVLRTWAGWIDLSLDLVPVIGSAEEVPGLYLACGYSAHGFCLGPVSGKILSEMITGSTSCVDSSSLGLDRFKSIL